MLIIAAPWPAARLRGAVCVQVKGKVMQLGDSNAELSYYMKVTHWKKLNSSKYECRLTCTQQCVYVFSKASKVSGIRQDAQLSQRDRAAGWVSYGQKWKTGTAQGHLRWSKSVSIESPYATSY